MQIVSHKFYSNEKVQLVVKKLRLIDGDMSEWSNFLKDKPVFDFIDIVFRGIAQGWPLFFVLQKLFLFPSLTTFLSKTVVFMNNPVTGLFIVIALFVASWV